MGTRRMWPTESSKQAAKVLIGTEVSNKWPALVCTRSWAYGSGLLAWHFVRFLTVGAGVSLTLLPAVGALFSVSLSNFCWGHLPCLSIRFFVICSCCLSEACSFLMGEGGNVHRGQAQTGGCGMRSRGRGNFGQNALNEKKICF